MTLYANPFFQREDMNANLGLFAQDSWRLNRLTLNVGLRFEYVNASIPAHNLCRPASSSAPRATTRSMTFRTGRI